MAIWHYDFKCVILFYILCIRLKQAHKSGSFSLQLVRNISLFIFSIFVYNMCNYIILEDIICLPYKILGVCVMNYEFLSHFL